MALRTLLLLRWRVGRLDSVVVAKWFAERPESGPRLLSPTNVELSAGESLVLRLFVARFGNLSDDFAPHLSQDMRRTLRVAEEVSDLERQLETESRVPRVAGRLSASGGLLAAAFVVREGLSSSPVVESAVDHLRRVLEGGLTMATFAVLGGIACASLHRAAQREQRLRLNELDQLVAQLTVGLPTQ